MTETKRIVEKFEIPEVAVPFLQRFFTKEDLQLIERVPKDAFMVEDATGAIGKDAAEYLEEAYRRGVVSYRERDKNIYRLSNFYGFLDVFAVTQKERYHTEFTRKERGDIDAWYFDAYVNSLNPDFSKRPTEDVILTLEEALEYVDRDDRQLFWTHCDCKCLLGDCGLPTKVCLSYYQGDNSYSDRQVSEPVTKEQAKQIIRDADKAGLIHTWNPSGFCSCCGDCCYLFRAQQVRGSVHFWPIQNYEISFSADKCIGCGLCIKRCHFSAFSRDESGKIHVDTNQCQGCGLCANTCPKKALELVKLGGKEHEL